jgi:aminopeptidase-like protein
LTNIAKAGKKAEIPHYWPFGMDFLAFYSGYIQSLLASFERHDGKIPYATGYSSRQWQFGTNQS